MGAKLDSSLVERDSRNKPGPGSYDLAQSNTGPKQPAFKIGTSKRSESTKIGDKRPEPGTYSPDASVVLSKTGQIKFGTSKRPEIGGKASNVPGPGNYNTSLAQKARFAMGIKLKDLSKTETPAPG